MTPENNRLKSAMIVFALENCLGELVTREFPGDPELLQSGTFKKVGVREALSVEATAQNALKAHVAASFLEEVLLMAVETTRLTALHDSVCSLNSRARELELFAIRNAVSHPNREFPDHYWYRVAAIASDPIIDKLGFYDVRSALVAAESGVIKAPPDEWLKHSYSSTPNNLPREFEHESTGLIGRQRERRELLSQVTGGRYQLISVIAPGGLGKTALALDVLRECALDPRSREWCDGIIFLSFKQERLTAGGVESLTAAQTITELSVELAEELNGLFPSFEFSSFEEAMRLFSKHKILLCVDNLETLLRDSPSAFTEFYERLPATWRVLLTSRITVDGAKSLTLGALSIEGARALTYRYFGAKGLETPGDQVVNQIVDASAKNPLALRLMVDHFANGHRLIDAKAAVEKDIVAFSYRNLVETLSEDALMVLECLFVRDNFTRAELMEILRFDADSAAEAVRQLTATSLLMRRADDEDERFTLSPSVRDLLRENPRNLKVRSSVRRQIDEQARSIRQHRSIQTQHGFSPFSEDWVDPQLPSNLSALLVQAIKLLRTTNPHHQQVVDLLNRLTIVLSQYKTFAIAHISAGRLFLLATDSHNAEQAFRAAVEVDATSPTARLVLINYLLSRERPEEAVDLAEELLSEGWDEVKRSDEFTARRVWICYFRALSDMGRYDDVIAAGARATGSDAIRTAAKHSIANALILKAGPIHQDSPSSALSALTEAAGLLEEKPASSHTVKYWKAISRFLVKELRHLLEVSSEEEFCSDDLVTIFHLIAPNIGEAHDRITHRNLQSELIPTVALFQRVVESEENPFQSKQWKSFTSRDTNSPERIVELVSDGFEILTIYKIPNHSVDRPLLFAFAVSEASERYYILRSYCPPEDRPKWDSMVVGAKIAAKHFVSPENEGNYPIATEFVML